ncbi:MAG: hypothetical protein IPM98_13020 [Lewinellaceae bacterium]|nr:hypothetical protein [Lewinellaceae bacterium]
MSRTPHIIRRQAVRLQVSRRDNVLALQQRFLQLMEERVLPRLEPVFDRLAGPGEWIELDKLDVDLGHLAPDESDQVWLDQIVGAYTAALERHITASDTFRVTPAARATDLLVFFLKNGALPWWAAGQRIEAVVREHLPAVAEYLPALLESAVARQRWVRQFDDALQTETFRAVAKRLFRTAPPEQILPVSLTEWLNLFPDAPRRALRNSYWETLWEALLQPATFPESWLSVLLRQTIALLPANPTVWAKTLDQWLDSSVFAALPESVKEQFVQAFAAILTPQHGTIPPESGHGTPGQLREMLYRYVRHFPGTEARPATAADDHPVSAWTRFEEVQPRRDAPAARLKSRLPVTEAEGLLVPLAGIVLIHPLLPAFFEHAGLLHAGKFADEAARERAVHLLYHAATGLQHPFEEELPLLKLLCGMELQTPVERSLDLTDAEQTETLRLLQALSSQWDALEGATPDDLRGSFLVREGKLQHSDPGWRLTVEEKPWDILLTKLPWSVSPVLHAWMRDMLWVDWA